MEHRARRMMDPELLEAFEKARYRVIDPGIDIKIGENNPDLDELLSASKATWAFITPFNPHSKVLSDEENEVRLKYLKKMVARYFTYDGTGGGLSDKWPLEKSLLILGINLTDAVKIGRMFDQDAIVYGVKGKPARVVALTMAQGTRNTRLPKR